MDIITYVDNLEDFKLVGVALAKRGHTCFTLDEDDMLVVNVPKVPLCKLDNESITLIRVDEMLECPHLFRLGECINNYYYFDTDEDKKTYERIYGDLTVEYVDEDGVAQSYKRPYMNGVFA